MFLAVDIGNTDTKIGVFDNNSLAARWVVHSDRNRGRAEYADAWAAMLAHFGFTSVASAVIGSVVPVLTPVIGDAVEQLCGRAPTFIRAQEVPGIRLRVDEPAQVGVDRIANAIGARTLYGAPAIVADMGSTTNFDVVDRNGDLIGVLIALGMGATARALTSAAAQLPDIRIERPSDLVGANTVAAIRSGVYWGHVHMVRGLIGQLREELGKDFRVIGTGGLAPLLSEDIGVFDEVDADLTLKGLALIKHAMDKPA